MMKGHVVKTSQVVSVAMVADRQHQVAGQLPSLVAIEQVNQAMLIARNKDCDRGPLIGQSPLCR